MNASIRLFLTRHGQTAWNQQGRFQGHTDVPLDDVGRAQAAALVEKLRGQVQAAIASDLQRASETARIITDALQIPLLRVDPDLRERGYGVFEGLTREDCIAQYPDVWAAKGNDRNFEPPGSEPCALVRTRMERALNRAVAEAQGRHEHLLIVGHGSSLRMFIEQIHDGPVETFGNLHFREVVHDGARFAYVPRAVVPEK